MKKKLKCKYCKFKTVRGQEYLENHIKRRHPKRLDCPECDYGTTKSFHLKVHMMGKHWNQFPHVCTMCDYHTTTKGQLNAHVRSKHEPKLLFYCDFPDCEYFTSSERHLETHTKNRHLKQYKTAYNCLHCDRKLKTPQSLKNHIMVIHTKEMDSCCPICGYVTLNDSRLKLHISSQHTDNEPCPYEGCKFQTSENKLQLHIKNVHLRKYRLQRNTRGNDVKYSSTGIDNITMEHNLNWQGHVEGSSWDESSYSEKDIAYLRNVHERQSSSQDNKPSGLPQVEMDSSIGSFTQHYTDSLTMPCGEMDQEINNECFVKNEDIKLKNDHVECSAVDSVLRNISDNLSEDKSQQNCEVLLNIKFDL